MPYGWDDAPAHVRAQVSSLADRAQEIFGDSLASVVLHGSLAMGCFHPERSDVDLLVIASRAPTHRQLEAFARATLLASGDPAPVELSVVRALDLEPFTHPAPYDLHVSESSRAAVARRLEEGTLAVDPRSTDVDLAAHVVTSIARGVVLAGADMRALTSGVPVEHWIDAVVTDAEQIRAAGSRGDPVYAVLNLCRVFRFLLDTQVSSKAEGGTWALTILPPNHAATAQRMLDAYGSRAPWPAWSVDVEACVGWIGTRIDQLVAVRGFSRARAR